MLVQTGIDVYTTNLLQLDASSWSNYYHSLSLAPHLLNFSATYNDKCQFNKFASVLSIDSLPVNQPVGFSR